MKAVFKTTGGKDPVKDSTASYSAGEVIFHQGDLGTDMFIIQEGEVQIIKNINGASHILSKLEKGDFMGRDVLQRERAEGPRRKLVGFEMVERGIARHGYPVVDGKEEIGVVTSGTHSPTLKKPIGLAYLPLGKSAANTEFSILIRGKETRARVVPTPFYKRAK